VLSRDESRYSAEQFRRDFRLQRDSFTRLCAHLNPHWDSHLGRARVEIQTGLLMLLYRLGSPDALRTLSTVFGYERSHILHITRHASQQLVKHCSHWIRCPATGEEWKAVARRWEQSETHMINIVGAIDGIHIPIKRPTRTSLEFINRKGWSSYNVQALCDERGLFTDVCIGSPGCMNDIGNLYLSELYHHRSAAIPQGYFVIGDGGYVLLPWMLIPFDVTECNTVEKRLFNKMLSQQRVRIEQAFGRLKARWRKLLTRMDMTNQDDVKNFIACGFLLHNYCERNGDLLLQEELREAAAARAERPDHQDEPADSEEARGAGVAKLMRENYVEALWERAR
jgi:hypothetical protein